MNEKALAGMVAAVATWIVVLLVLTWLNSTGIVEMSRDYYIFMVGGASGAAAGRIAREIMGKAA